MTAREKLVRPDRYPRSSAYDPAWLLSLDMGPNPLWMLEDLARDLDLRPGTRVLDLGSGQGATSAVFAEAGVGAQVEAVRAEAHVLPFEKESFDAIVSIDAFEYFGTADGYLPQWEITELVTVGSARLQDEGWRDWLLWTRAVAEHAADADPAIHQPMIDMLMADGGEFLGFALVTARKN